MAKTEKAGGKGKKDKKGRKEEVSPKSVEDIAAPLGYSMEARLRVLSGTKSALMGVDQLPEKTSVLSFVQANPEGLSNVYAGVQTAWNHERENVSLTREQWGVNAAKATLRLLRNHRENPEELALLQTAFQGWGVDIDTNILGDMSKIAEQLPRVAASFSGQFYDAYCGEGQAKGVRALEEGLVQAMDQSYITSFGKYGKHTERFYIDPQGQMESSQNIRSSLTLLDPFLARYFGNEDLYTAFQVSLAANLTARAASFYPSEIAVSPITDSEKQALALIAAHIPESTGARRDVPATVEMRALVGLPPEPGAAPEPQPQPKDSFAILEHDLTVLSLPTNGLKRGARILHTETQKFMEQLHQKVDQMKGEGFEKSPDIYKRGSQAVDQMHQAGTQAEQIKFLYEGAPIADLVRHHYVMNYLQQRQTILDILARGEELSTTDSEMVELASKMGRNVTKLSLAIVGIGLASTAEQNEALLQLFRGTKLADDSERFGGIANIEQQAMTTMFRAIKQILADDMPPIVAEGGVLSEDGIRVIFDKLAKRNELQVGNNLDFYLNRLKSMPMLYDQLYFILCLLKKERETPRQVVASTSGPSRREKRVRAVRADDPRAWLLGEENDPFSLFSPPPAPGK